MATHATGAANLSAFHPVQLTLQLCSQRPGSTRVARPRLSYWERVDLADVGGELQTRNHAVRVLIAAQPDCGTWTGYYDAPFFSGTGVGGPTRPTPSRLDALSTAAHAVARHCQRLLDAQPQQQLHHMIRDMLNEETKTGHVRTTSRLTSSRPTVSMPLQRLAACPPSPQSAGW